jgi:nicotinate-nucleotide pyrophosphorylase (carboxylating)
MNHSNHHDIDYYRDLLQQVQFALQEDIGNGDLTAELIGAEVKAHATIICREQAILCGQAWFDETFRQLNKQVSIDWHNNDGDQIEADQTICTLHSFARHLLTAERTALNFLQTLSGTATTANRYATALEGLHTKVLDTRKTLPGLRLAQKYAVMIGGCRNHRIGLYDAILIKENHISACGSILQAVNTARLNHGVENILIEVEVENLEQLQEALNAGVDRILLDNMDEDSLHEAVALNANRAELEASGNITLDNIRNIAETGVDYISIGALTKHVRAVDLSMRIEFIAE